jgi:thiol-disulfide isomerase/thioredoxin
MRNDELYIPILEALVESPLYDEYDRIAPLYDLELARQNRIGNVANDIVYTLANGKTGRLHSIDSEYVILMFSNPGCPMCREIIEEITSSPLINEMMENDLVEVLAIYPDEDLAAWRDHVGDIPQSWINAYDAGMCITEARSYNLQAIPSLYLLDSEKRVIIKDGTSVAQIENAIAYFEAM